jgi:hypothetical protein
MLTNVAENQDLLRILEDQLMGMAYRYRLTPWLTNWRNNPSIHKILPGYSLSRREETQLVSCNTPKQQQCI